MKKINPLRGFGLVVFGILISTPTQALQRIMPAGTGSDYVGSQETITYAGIYTVSSPQTGTETGIGLRVHYNSSLLTPTNNQLYSSGAQPVGEITDDIEDFDSDPLTDKFFILAWVDVNAQWPGQAALPLNLFEAQFTTVANFNQDTGIRITATSTAQNQPVFSGYLKVCPKPTISFSDTISIYPNGIVREIDTSSASFNIISNLPAECGGLALNYTITGSATPDSDYTALPQAPVNFAPSLPLSGIIGLHAIDDDDVETDETVIMTLEGGTDYLLGSPASATITIQSEDTSTVLPEVNLSTGKTGVTEGSSGSLIIYAARSNEDLSLPLEVFIQPGGTASAGSDYQPFPESIIIPAGKEQGFATLVLKDDANNESQETITLSIIANTQYQRGTSSTLQLTIEDDEISQNTSLEIDKAKVEKGNHSIPTLNEWMLLLMSLLMAGLALTHLIITRRGNA